ncbi:unnamed protein product [Amoebophrya sp. A120]|nr:unnamed protein product [Amoebophrya sp. A120]|eukprot:GSA120T00004603001.1
MTISEESWQQHWQNTFSNAQLLAQQGLTNTTTTTNNSSTNQNLTHQQFNQYNTQDQQNLAAVQQFQNYYDQAAQQQYNQLAQQQYLYNQLAWYNTNTSNTNTNPANTTNSTMGYYDRSSRNADIGDSRRCMGLFLSRGRPGEKDVYTGKSQGMNGSWDDVGISRLVGEWRKEFKKVTDKYSHKPAHQRPTFLITDFLFEQNKIGDEGAKTIFEFLLEYKVKCNVIKLYKNDIGDTGAYYIAKYLRGMEDYAVRELHLSDNYMGAKGMEDLFQAVVGNKMYPKEERRGPSVSLCPLWLRIENNCITNFMENFAKMVQEATDIRTRFIQPGYCSETGAVKLYKDKAGKDDDNWKGYVIRGQTGPAFAPYTCAEINGNFPALHVIFGQKQHLHKVQYTPRHAKMPRPVDALLDLFPAGVASPNFKPTVPSSVTNPASLTQNQLTNGGGKSGPPQGAAVLGGKNVQNLRQLNKNNLPNPAALMSTNGNKPVAGNSAAPAPLLPLRVPPAKNSSAAASGGGGKNSGNNSNVKGNGANQQQRERSPRRGGQSSKDHQQQQAAVPKPPPTLEQIIENGGTPDLLGGVNSEEEFNFDSFNGGFNPFAAEMNDDGTGNQDGMLDDNGDNFGEMNAGDDNYDETTGDNLQTSADSDSFFVNDIDREFGPQNELIERHNGYIATMGLEELPNDWIYAKGMGNKSKIYYFNMSTRHATTNRGEVFLAGE